MSALREANEGEESHGDRFQRGRSRENRKGARRFREAATAARIIPITKVRVETDVDVDGDPALLVRFVYDSPEGWLPEDAIYYGFLTVLHDEVRDVMGYPGYPLAYFIWQKEFEEVFEEVA